jgi:hypothetical protein
MAHTPNPNPHPSDDDKFERMRKEYEARWQELSDGSQLTTKVKELIDENIPAIAHEMVRLALHASKESLRFQASRYLLDHRVFGLANDKSQMSEFLEKFEGLQSEAKPPSE